VMVKENTKLEIAQQYVSVDFVLFLLIVYICQFVSCEVVNKPSQITLGHRNGKVPPAPTLTSRSPQVGFFMNLLTLFIYNHLQLD
jgi:hypothetical protein